MYTTATGMKGATLWSRGPRQTDDPSGSKDVWLAHLSVYLAMGVIVWTIGTEAAAAAVEFVGAAMKAVGVREGCRSTKLSVLRDVVRRHFKLSERRSTHDDKDSRNLTTSRFWDASWQQLACLDYITAFVVRS